MKGANFLSPRLAAVLSCVEKCGVLADIGTDHAYLPIEAVRAGLCKCAIACDVSVGPLKIAARNIRAAGFCGASESASESASWQTHGQIETRLGDGLAPLEENEADCIVIAGMGGMKIIEILTAKKIGAGSVATRTILQPQHDLEELRRFLHASRRIIIEEKLVRETARFYVIIVAEAARTGAEVATWTDAEYFLGRIEGADAVDYYREMQRKILAYFDEITDETAREIAKKRLEWVKKRIKERMK